MKDSLKEFDLYTLKEASRDRKSLLLSKREIHGAPRVLPPCMRKTVLDCLRKKKFLLNVPGEETGSKSWIIKCVELLFRRPNAPRRRLARQSHRRLAPTPVPALAPMPASVSPSYGLGPSDLVPASSPLQNPRATPLEGPEVQSPSPGLIDLLPPPQKDFPPVHHNAPNNSAREHGSSHTEKIIIVAATAAGVLAFISLILFCCLKGSSNKIGPRDGQKDERPLLTLSMSDFSAGIHL